MSYPKIDTLYKRDEKGRIFEEYSRDEFTLVEPWLVTEKIDGTNIRIESDGQQISIRGRTDKAQVQPQLIPVLTDLFPTWKFANFPDKVVTLYGEGFGGSIQKAGKYYGKPNFILFDVNVDGHWLNRADVESIASSMGIPAVPIIGVMNLPAILDMVKKPFKSQLGPLNAEGVVVRTEPLLLFRDGRPLMWKLKLKDFLRVTE